MREWAFPSGYNGRLSESEQTLASYVRQKMVVEENMPDGPIWDQQSPLMQTTQPAPPNFKMVYLNIYISFLVLKSYSFT